MTILNNGTRNQYTATSGQTSFTYNFEIFSEDDLVVFQGETLLVLTTDYTVSGVNAENGGSVTLVTGATTGDILTLFRETAPERLTDYQNSGDFLAEEVNADIDRLWGVVQENKTTAERVLTFAQTSVVASATVADPVTGKTLKWDASGNLINTDTDIDLLIADATAQADASEASAIASAASAGASSTSAGESAASAAASQVSADASEVSRLASGVSADESAASAVEAALQAASASTVAARNSAQNQDSVSATIGATTLTINEGTLMSFAEGFNANGQVDTQELVGAGVTVSLGVGFESQTYYLYKDKGGAYGFNTLEPQEGTSRAQADKGGTGFLFDYYNVVSGIMFDGSDVAITRVYLAKIVTGAAGEILSFENLPVAKTKGVDAEYQGDVTVHNEIKNRGICTAWVNFDGTTNPPTIRDSYNVADVVKESTGQYNAIFETPMDNIAYVPLVSADDAQDNGVVYQQLTTTSVDVRFINNAGAYTDANMTLAVFGGKDIL